MYMSDQLLDLYTDPAVYDSVYKGNAGDFKFYSRLIKGRSSCYLGIGTGRLFGRLADINQAIVGLDNSPEMVNRLFERFPKLEPKKVLFLDARKIRDKGKFDIVIAPHSFLTQFSYQDYKLLLRKVFSSLKPGGIFVTDFFSPFKNPHFKKESEILKKFNKDGSTIIQRIDYDYVYQNLTERVVVKHLGRTYTLTIKLNYYYPNEIEREFKDAGFVIERFSGGYSKHSLSVSDNLFVIQAKKPN